MIMVSFLFGGSSDAAPDESVVEIPKQKIEPIVWDNAFSLALIGGLMDIHNSNLGWRGLYGIELSFGLLSESPNREQIQLTRYESGALRMLQANLTLYPLFKLTGGTWLGVGPTVGIAAVKSGSWDETLFTYGVSLDLRKEMGERLFAGIETRYEWSSVATIGGRETDFDNAKVLVKAGYRF